ncbi:MAG: hydantoinase/oxoprolinase family protein [Methylocystis sp.]|uniref:hydantoinase/oxoprolinase family protein n=1 Tax=Methylocystis sp. TaxID=1911079 RepID=UPI00392D8E9C
MAAVIGWDIGGAHVKAARADDGRLTRIVQLACAPHESVASLEQALRDAHATLGDAERHRVTMTAELSDAFESRARGVVVVAAIAAREIGVGDILFYAGERGYVARDEIGANVDAIASANWRAAAELVARHHADALFIDIGSTTADLTPICASRVAAVGASDAERLARGELAYAGFSRGAPQAYATHAPVAGQWTPLVNEGFASMADVRRVLGELPEGETDADLSPTTDGRPKTVAASRARLARLAGCDAADLTDAQSRAFAQYLARAQLRAIEDQIALLESREAMMWDAPIVGAGVGRKLAARLAQARGCAFIDFAELIAAPPALAEKAANCAPASALALLAE